MPDRPYVRAHAALNDQQRRVLRARCKVGGRGEAGVLLGMSEWNVGRVLRSIACCADDAQACWEHRTELEAVEA